MKKIRVHSVINGILIFYGIIVGLQIIIHYLFKFEIAQYLNLHNLIHSIIILGLARLFGIISKNDFYKDIEGGIIDKYEFFRWNNLTLSTPFIVLSIFQIFYSFVSPDFVSPDNLLGLHLKSDLDKFLISTFILYPFPTLIFIIRSFMKRSIINENDLIKIKRRERIRTSDLYELIQKVDLEEWIQNDPILQKDRKLLSEACIYAPTIFKYVDIKLKADKSFVLEFVKADIKSIVLLEIYSPNFFQDRDVVIQYLKCFPSGVEWVDKSFLSDPEVLDLLKTTFNDK
jgi:hypothetical protein